MNARRAINYTKRIIRINCFENSDTRKTDERKIVYQKITIYNYNNHLNSNAETEKIIIITKIMQPGNWKKLG